MMSVLLRRSLRQFLFRRSFRAGVIETKYRLYANSARPLRIEDHTNFLATTQCGIILPCQLRKFSSTGKDTTCRKECSSLKIEKGGQELSLSWNDDEALKDSHNDLSLYAVWLRHNCQCPECMADNGQSTIAPELLDPSIKLHSADISGNLLNLAWSSGHNGYINVDWLKRNTNIDTVSNSAIPVATTVPRLSAVGMELEEEKQWKWLYYLNEYGSCVLTDYGTEKNSVTKLAKLMYNVQATVFGEIFDVVGQENPSDLAYSTAPMFLHTDQPYYESAPGIQLLHCLRFDSCLEGGETIIIDVLPVIEEMRTKFPRHLDTLQRVPTTFHRIQYHNKAEPVDMTYYAPHIVLDKNGKLTSVRWSPQHAAPPLIPKDDMLPYYAAYNCFTELLNTSSLKLKFRLQPGEVLTTNNRRFLHTREGFKLNGGMRHLQGTYVNIDEFKSKFHVLCNKLGKQDHPVRRVFNGSFFNIN